jgi:GTP cyclohydrolase II
MAYGLQDRGHNTSDANVLLGHPVDARDFELAGHILAALGLRRVRLMTNNRLKITALERAGIDVERVPAWVESSEHAQGYLNHKRAVMAHLG